MGPLGPTGPYRALELLGGAVKRAEQVGGSNGVFDEPGEGAEGPDASALGATPGGLASRSWAVGELRATRKAGEVCEDKALDQRAVSSGAMDSESYRVTIGAHTAGASAGMDLYTAREAMRAAWLARRSQKPHEPEGAEPPSKPRAF